jgi:flagellar assembly protein FliH
MSTIIKATDRNRGIHGVAFNFDDMAQRADEYLGQIRDQARQILAQASKDAQAIRQQAENEGRQAAQLASNEMLDNKVAEQMKTVLPALRAAVEGIVQAQPGWLAQWENGAVRLAARMAARVLRRELQSDPQVALPLLREALELSRGSADVRVLLNPDDYAALRDQVQTLAAEVSRVGAAQVVPDPRVTPGGCRIETRHGAIDQQFEVQLSRIVEELI